MNVLSAPVTVLLSELNNEPSLLIAGALTTFVTVIVSVPSPVAERAVDTAASGAPNLANIDGGWRADGGGAGIDDEVGGACGSGGDSTALVCRGSANGARGAAGNVTVPKRGTGAAAFGVTQLLSGGCTYIASLHCFHCCNITTQYH